MLYNNLQSLCTVTAVDFSSMLGTAVLCAGSKADLQLQVLFCHQGVVAGVTGTAMAASGHLPEAPPIDPAKAAAEAQAEALRLTQLEAIQNMSFIRRWSFRISTHEDFEMVVFVIIFANIVTLAMYNPLKPDSSGYNYYLDRIRKTSGHAVHSCLLSQ